MPRFVTLLRIVTMAFGLVMAARATAADYVIAVPQVLDRQHAQTLHADVQRLVLEEAEPDDVIRIVDATDLKTIAVFKIPTGGKARVKNLRLDALSEPLAAWKRFAAERYVQARHPASGRVGGILLPQLLDHLGAEAYADRPRDQREICVLVVGSAQHRDPREPSFDMTEGRFPADGLLLASRTRSPYGTADRQGRLQGIFVNMLVLDRDWLSELQRLRTHRAWQLFVEAQGGVLATFTADRTVALERFMACERKPAETFAWDSTRTTEAMITAERIGQTVAEPQSVQDAVPETVIAGATPEGVELSNDDWLRNESIVASAAPPDLDRANLRIGIRWGDDGACRNSDLDLYVRSSPDRPYLFFNNMTSPDGRFEKDFRTAPDRRQGLEIVEIIDRVRLANLDILVNYYGGSCATQPRGTIRAYVNGVVYEAPFEIRATRGNSGRDRGNGPHWVRIDPRTLFNLE